jgi:hypothetical protein
MNEWSVKVIHQNLSRDTHFVYREHTSNWLFFGKLWSLQTFSIYVAQNITGRGSEKSHLLLKILMSVSQYLRTTKCLSIVFFFKFRYHWNGRMVFRCYFCALESGTLKEIIDHCSVLDDKSGKFRFQTKYHQGIIYSK